MAETPIFCNGHIVGKVTARTFCKVISGSKHLLRKPAAIAFDKTTLKDARKAGALTVAVTDRETGKTYRAPIDDIETHGFGVFRGFGSQVALALTRFSVDGKEPEAASRYSTNTERIEAQPSLFDMAVMP
mgnify:CR=1 FL=1